MSRPNQQAIGTLYMVSTPIGNLEDITLRALRMLKEVDFVAAEDTRHSGILLKKYEISTPLLSFHSHSGDAKIRKIVDLLVSGKSIALISDAGTPGISDPAFSLIQACLEHEIQISPIPGASALLAGLVISGLPMNNFLYLGFLPVKKGRNTLLQTLSEEKRTMIIFESPHRIEKTLAQLCEIFGPQRRVAICREITKIHEEVFRGNLEKAWEKFTQTKPKGEFVIVLAGAEKVEKVKNQYKTSPGE
jgi:16S rRNA (cytidine1402-2'-O)-methyltransferase